MVVFVVGMWFIILCDPQWYIASYGASAARNVPTFLFAGLVVSLLVNWPRRWNAPLLAFFLYTTATMLFVAYIRGRAFVPTKQLMLYYVLVVATVTFVRKPREALPILVLYFVGQYIWWVGFGVRNGRVPWHPTNGNFDGYGPLMDLGIPACFYFGLAVKDRRLKWLAFATAGGAVIALVSAFARGAILSGAVVAFWMWLRSPGKNKMALTLALVAGFALVAVGAKVFSDEWRGGDTKSNFWEEVGTSFTEAKTETGTAEDRYVLWQLARQVFLARPVFGVGAENFGPYAAEHFAVGTTGGEYDENPLRLYDRKLHSSYFQILAEYGAVGSLIFIWLLVDFFIKNRQLRSPAFTGTFDLALGGTLSLRHLALGLEGSMIGFLASGAFYNQLFVHWLYTIIGVNLLLYEVSKPRVVDGARLRPLR